MSCTALLTSMSSSADHLGAENVYERRLAALTLETSAEYTDSEIIRARLVVETDALTRTRLQRALLRAEGTLKRPDAELDAPVQESNVGDTESERVKARSDLATTFLHELTTILAAIKRGALVDLNEGYSGSATERAIDRFASFLKAMEHLRDAARPPDPEDFNLVELVDSTLATERDAQPNVELISTREDPLTVRGDRYLLELALVNGIRNAIDASPENERVLVNCGETPQEWWLNVLDNGVGIPANRDQVFVAGRSTKPKGEHEGLGLTIAKQAIESMGGVVEVTRRTTTGTEFRLRWSKA